MEEFLNRYKMLKLNQDQVNHLNNPITSKEIQVIKSLPTIKSPGPGGFSAEFYLTFIGDITQILSKRFQKTESDGIPPHSFFEAT